MANLPPDARVKFQANSGTQVINGAQATALPPEQQTQQGVNTATQAATPVSGQPEQKTSGMFTNIKSYIQRNQPQAQAMAGAVAQDFSKQASNIANQAQQREQQFKNQIQSQQKNIEAQKQWGTDLINQTSNVTLQPNQQANVENLQNIYAQPQPIPTGGQSTPTTNPTDIAKQSQDNYSKFQNLLSGATESQMSDVRDLDLSKQQYKAQALQNIASGAKTDVGRADLLSDTFSKNRAYTQGQSGLDTALLGRNEQARNLLAQKTKEATTGLEAGLKEKYAQSLGAKSGLRTQAEAVKGELKSNVDKAMEDVYASAELAAKEKKNAIQQEQDRIKNAFTTGQGLTDEMISKYVDVGNIEKQKQDIISQANQALTGSYKGRANNFENAFGENYGKTYANLQKQAEKLLSSKQYKAEYNKLRSDGNEDAVRQLKNKITENLYKDYVQNKTAELSSKSPLDYIRAKVAAGTYGAGDLSFAGTEDINAQTAASEDQLARYEALKRLSGSTGQGKLDMLKDRYSRGQEASGKLTTGQNKYKDWV